MASQNQENDIVVIPGLKGRDAKEISVKNLSHIIQARMEEIIEQVYYEIRNSGFEKKWIDRICSCTLLLYGFIMKLSYFFACYYSDKRI